MKVSIFVCTVLAVVAITSAQRVNPPPRFWHKTPPPPPARERAGTIVSDWFYQKLTHFDDSDTRMWYQRFHLNNYTYKEGGPIFLMVEGESQANPNWLLNSHQYQMALDHGALLLQLEHRFYGESRPTEDVTNKNLAYLKIEEALADVANFVTSYKQSHPEFANSKVIVFGGSYPGNLVAWVREKYPDVIHGAVASSAPVFTKADFLEYLEQVTQSLNTSGADCIKTIKDATNEMSRLLTTPDGAATLTSTFYLCTDLDGNDPNEVTNLFETMAGIFSGVVQYNNDYRDDIGYICNSMTSGSNSPLDKYAALAGGSPNGCIETSYASFIDYYAKDKTWNGNGALSSALQWYWQTCTQMGYFQSTSSPIQVFGDNMVPAEFFAQICKDFFGEEFNLAYTEDAVTKTNQEYGGRKPNVTNVVFVDGTIDPWHRLAITENLSDDAQAILVEGTSHCYDMYEDSSYDLPQLTEARKKIRSLVASWLSQ